MTPLVPATIIRPPVREFIAACMAHGASRTAAKAAYNADRGECWQNEKYTVLLVMHSTEDFLLPEGTAWLSVRRNDREPLADWRDIQAIKNQLIGPECEAVQLFPAESRLVDTANQYHFVALRDPGQRFGFGFTFRAVSDTGLLGSKNKPLEGKTP